MSISWLSDCLLMLFWGGFWSVTLPKLLLQTHSLRPIIKDCSLSKVHTYKLNIKTFQKPVIKNKLWSINHNTHSTVQCPTSLHWNRCEISIFNAENLFWILFRVIRGRWYATCLAHPSYFNLALNNKTWDFE